MISIIKNNMKTFLRIILETAYVTIILDWQCLKYGFFPLISDICKIKPKGFCEKIELRTKTFINT